MKTEMTNLLRNKGHSKLDLRNSLRGNVVYVVKSVTKEQIVGHWTVTRIKGLPDTTTKMTAIKIISSMAIVTIVTKRAIKKLIAAQNSMTMRTTQERNLHSLQQII